MRSLKLAAEWLPWASVGLMSAVLLYFYWRMGMFDGLGAWMWKTARRAVTPRWLVAEIVLLAITVAAQKPDTQQRLLRLAMGEPFGRVYADGAGHLGSTGVAVSDYDIANGYRLVGVVTNETPVAEIPSNAVECVRWSLRGGREMRFALDLNGFAFPLKGDMLNRISILSGGAMETLHPANPAIIAAAREFASFVPGISRFWSADADDGAKVLRWDNVFAERACTDAYSAEIRLYPNGDFVTRSNEVERVYRRIHPSDWDGDGILNGDDENPRLFDGDFCGPANVLPVGANPNAYCIVSVVAEGPDAEIKFVGDRPSDYHDPHFIAKSGVTNDVLILLGKRYEVSSDYPISFVGVSDSATEIQSFRNGGATIVHRPVEISVGSGNPFVATVNPSCLGGFFSWSAATCGCSVLGTGAEGAFRFSCPSECTCCGCTIDGEYTYEGYSLPVTSCLCGCHYNGIGPEWSDADTPLAASASASFSKSCVIYEAPYENSPGSWSNGGSTRTRLNITAIGGPDGATLSVSGDNLSKLRKISGPDLPLAPVNVPSGRQVAYSIVYEGESASDAVGDIVVSASVADGGGNGSVTNTACATSVRLELQAVYEAPENPCTNRHVYGVGEKIRFLHFPESAPATFSATKGDGGNPFSYYESFSGSISEPDKQRIYVCPIAACYTPNPAISVSDVSYTPAIALIEPLEVFTPEATWLGCHDFGDVGQSILVTTNYIRPMSVSFQGIMVAEIPCSVTNAPTGYFSTANYLGHMTHTTDAGAGHAVRIQSGNRWMEDRAGGGQYPNWSAGRLEWNIPIGWIRIQSDLDPYGWTENGEFTAYANPDSRPLLIGGRIDAYKQVFTIDEEGTSEVRKFGHRLSRSRYCHIILDGETKQRIHPLW